MELAPGLHAIGQKRGGRVHAFLAEAGGELTLIDTLFDSDGRRILEAVARVGGPLKRIAITHGHRSHLGGVAALKRETGATVYAHDAEAGIVAGTERARPVPLTFRPPVLIPFRLGLRLGLPKHPPCPVDEALAEGDSFGPFQVVHAPGHSPGHLGFWWPERRALIAGDAIATWPKLEPGWHAFQLDPGAHERSLRRFASFEPAVVGVGHGEPLTQAVPDQVHALAERVPHV